MIQITKAGDIRKKDKWYAGKCDSCGCCVRMKWEDVDRDYPSGPNHWVDGVRCPTEGCGTFIRTQKWTIRTSIRFM